MFSKYTKSERAAYAYEDEGCCITWGKLIDIINSFKESYVETKDLPEALIVNEMSLLYIDGKDMCDKRGNLYDVLDNRYVLKYYGGISDNELEDAVNNGVKSLELKVYDLVDKCDVDLVFELEKVKVTSEGWLDVEATPYSVKK